MISELERQSPLLAKLRTPGACACEEAATTIELLAKRVDELRDEMREAERQSSRDIRDAAAEADYNARSSDPYGTF